MSDTDAAIDLALGGQPPYIVNLENVKLYNDGGFRTINAFERNLTDTLTLTNITVNSTTATGVDFIVYLSFDIIYAANNYIKLFFKEYTLTKDFTVNNLYDLPSLDITLENNCNIGTINANNNLNLYNNNTMITSIKSTSPNLLHVITFSKTFTNYTNTIPQFVSNTNGFVFNNLNYRNGSIFPIASTNTVFNNCIATNVELSTDQQSFSVELNNSTVQIKIVPYLSSSNNIKSVKLVNSTLNLTDLNGKNFLIDDIPSIISLHIDRDIDMAVFSGLQILILPNFNKKEFNMKNHSNLQNLTVNGGKLRNVLNATDGVIHTITNISDTITGVKQETRFGEFNIFDLPSVGGCTITVTTYGGKISTLTYAQYKTNNFSVRGSVRGFTDDIKTVVFENKENNIVFTFQLKRSHVLMWSLIGLSCFIVIAILFYYFDRQ